MKPLLLVGAGGALGAIARYLVGIAVVRWLGAAFPFNTLTVNVVGSFIMGTVIAGLMRFDPQPVWAADVRWFIAVGALGGFTTFSSFSADVAALWEKEAHGWMALYIVGSVTLSIAAVFVGLHLVRRIAG